jgi:uncharacterized protein (DUF1800 family)
MIHGRRGIAGPAKDLMVSLGGAGNTGGVTTSDEQRALIGHLLRRTGFGASGPEIDAAVAAGYEATLDSLFAPIDDPGADATAPPVLADPEPGGRQTPAQQRTVGRESAEAGYDLIAWWISRMTAVHNPWTEKRTFFWHGHFATSIQKVRSAQLMLAQSQSQRSLGGGDFRTLMRTMFTDPAMMLWLDAEGSTAKAPNENLARESMELFSLGVGNFTETDVRQAALALTGWRLDRTADQAVFDSPGHAVGPETIFGKTESFDVDSFTDLLMAQSANPVFVASRLWFRLASSATVPAATLSELTGAYGPSRDLTALARAIFLDPGFMADATVPGSCRYALVKQPVEYLVGVLRALRITPPTSGVGKDSSTLRAVLEGLGQLPFTPPNVGGWPSGRLWLTTAATQSRLDLAAWAVAKGDISAVTDASASSRVDAVQYLLGVDSYCDRTRAALNDLAGRPQALVALALLAPEYLVN